MEVVVRAETVEDREVAREVGMAEAREEVRENLFWVHNLHNPFRNCILKVQIQVHRRRKLCYCLWHNC